MKRTVMKGSKWRDELKLQIYRDCFEALEAHEKTGKPFYDCLIKRKISVFPMRGVYIRESKKDVPFVAYLVKSDVRFHVDDMPMPKWAGWKIIRQIAEQMGCNLRDAGKGVPSERSRIGDGISMDALSAAMRMPSLAELSAIPGRVTRVEYCLTENRLIRTEHMNRDEISASPQKEMNFSFEVAK